MKDLTQGHPGRVLLSYTLPLFGSVLFQQLYNIADSFVAGRWIGTSALAAVGNSYEITLIFIAVAMGCQIGSSVITAGYFGEKNLSGMKTCVHTALIFSGALALAMTLLGLVSGGALLRVIDTPQEIMTDSRVYLNIYLLGYLFMMLYNVSTGIFSAMGDSTVPFIFLACSSVANILVDILFVAGFHMGVAGVAWATCLCQTVSGLLALLCVLRRVHIVTGDARGRLFDRAILRRILRVAIPSALQQGFISVGNIMIQRVINGFGVAATGGYAAAIKLNNMTITSVTALGSGMSNYTAQNLGAKKTERLHQGFRWGLLVGAVASLLFGIVYLAFASPLVGLFISDGNADALRIGVEFLHIVAPFYPVIMVKLVCDGMLRGGQRMGVFMIATMTDLILRVVLCFVLSGPLGTKGIWYAWPVGWSIATVMSVCFYIRWMKDPAAPSAA